MFTINLPHKEKIKSTLVILIIVGGQILTLATGKEFWPFVVYPMFSEVNTQNEPESCAFYGIVGNQEVFLSKHFIFPLDRYSLCKNFRLTYESGKMKTEHIENKKRVKKKLKAIYEWYNDARLPSGPYITGVRLYKVKWRGDVFVKDIANPIKLDRMAEYRE